MIAYFAAFAFPFFILLIGSFLIFRGISKRETRSVSGKVRSAQGFQSHISKKVVTYSRLVIECYERARGAWKEIYSHVEKSDFLLSGRPVSMEFADVRLSNPLVHEGYVKRKKGTIEQLQSYLYLWGTRGALVLIPFHSFANKGELRFLDDELVRFIMSQKKAKSAIEKNIMKPMRISEYLIETGARITVASGSGTLRGTVEHPILITDSPENDARSTVDEKAKTSILLGAGLIFFSLMISLVLFASLKPF
jgi:hypothetical protein